LLNRLLKALPCLSKSNLLTWSCWIAFEFVEKLWKNRDVLLIIVSLSCFCHFMISKNLLSIFSMKTEIHYPKEFSLRLVVFMVIWKVTSEIWICSTYWIVKLLDWNFWIGCNLLSLSFSLKKILFWERLTSFSFCKMCLMNLTGVWLSDGRTTFPHGKARAYNQPWTHRSPNVIKVWLLSHE